MVIFVRRPEAAPAGSHPGWVAALLFGSGSCALIYQVAWLRELRLIFGASTAASAAVLAVFMGGLGAGGLLLGRKASERARPLLFYANLELGIAASAALTPSLLRLARASYVALGGTIVLGMTGATVLRLLLTALVLCVPTFLMGGTLPAAAQAIETEGDIGRRRLALLYGANTIGAVAGALLSTFMLLEMLGTRRMLWSACALNALIAMLARPLARSMAKATETVAPAPAPAYPAARPEAPRTILVVMAAALVGFAFLLMELVWYRMLSPLLGGSSFTFGLILAMALLGIGLGGIGYALLGGRRAPSPLGFAWTCGLEALFLALPFALGDRLAMVAALLRPLGAMGFGGDVAGWAVVVALVVLPAAIISGVQFPLLIALLGAGKQAVGRQVGLAYAWNTGGAIVGSLAGGFGLLPLLSAPGVWRCVVVLLAALGIAALALAARQTRPATVWPLTVALASLALLAAKGPTATWRHSGIGVGRAPSNGSPNALRAWSNTMRRSLAWEAEGVESSVAFVGHAFVVNGKADGDARSDAPTQVMSGMLGALLHPHLSKVMVVGLGTGSTAGWLASIPSVQKVDVAEIEPAILEVARACAPVNRNVMQNPKVRVLLGDAREYLLTSPEKYDLIFSEPSNPYRAGISSLFTQEFYQAATSRLASGGFFLQWLQAYAVDAETVRSVVATLATVFPQVETWTTQEADLLLVGSMNPVSYDLPRLRQKIQEEPYRSALAGVWRVNDVEGVLAHYLAGAALARAVAGLEQENVNTDDLTLVEFGFARGVGRRDSLLRTSELRQTTRALKLDRPPVTGGTVDWEQVDRRRSSMLASQEATPLKLGIPLSPESEQRALSEAAWLDGDFPRALALWRKQKAEPEDPTELALMAESLADSADPAAAAWIERVRELHPLEAQAFGARLRLRQGKVAEAATALEGVLIGYQSDPWPMPLVMGRALRLALDVAGKDRPFAERLFRLLERPFAVNLLDEVRKQTRVSLAKLVGFERLCVEAFSAFEPNVLWDRNFLTDRVRCYASRRHPAADAAQRDLTTFIAQDRMAFSTGLLPSGSASP